MPSILYMLLALYHSRQALRRFSNGQLHDAEEDLFVALVYLGLSVCEIIATFLG